MFRTAAWVCSGIEEKEESLALAQRVAAMNGYGKQISRSRKPKEVLPRVRDFTHAEKIAFCLPFISDEVSTAIRQYLRRAALDKYVAVVDIPPNNLKPQLIWNRMYDRICSTPKCVVCPEGRAGDCMTSGVVYMICCKSCGEEYIGETARSLCARIKEHLDGNEKSRLTTHRKARHDGANFEVTVKILAREPQTAARKTLEALLIHAKSPKMNRKGECLSITRELSPYLGLLF
ncbi:hypothetical protein Y032_0332g2753 [Ancylostoma ceylanicum]|uniref:GIY-YIG domain-containing protein n=1 Tax=Ancylostoma ceylanicum TaxID=53326 RepID=A0A016RZ39_9BILA|nr:hypothetical protein Y032_0332g2753 [Ancylostoma ceylanicum]